MATVKLGVLMLLVMAVACAADDGTAPDAPDIPIVQAAESPYCTRDSQCAGDATCAPDGSHCVGEDPDAHPCPAPAGTCAASDDPSCVDTTNDSYNCGGCGIRCPWGTAGVIFCIDSVCYSASGH